MTIVVRLPRRVRLAMEIALLLPERIPAVLGGGVIVLLGKFVDAESVDMVVVSG